MRCIEFDAADDFAFLLVVHTPSGLSLFPL